MARAAPDASVSRMLTAVFRYLADAVMLQLMSGEGVFSCNVWEGTPW